MTELDQATWFKSSFTENKGECVEVAHLVDARTAVRDSKSRADGALIVTAAQWSAFLTAARLP